MSETTAAKLARIETENAHTNQELARVRQKMDGIQNSLDRLSEKIDEQFSNIDKRMTQSDVDRAALKKDIEDLKPEVMIIRDSITFAKFGKRIVGFLASTGILGFLYAKWEIIALLWRK